MKLEENEYTIKGLLDYLNNKYKIKKTGKPFNRNDISQYIYRGVIPKQYGGHTIIEKKIQGVKILKLEK